MNTKHLLIFLVVLVGGCGTAPINDSCRDTVIEMNDDEFCPITIYKRSL
jgi:hypothetical protein